MWSAWESVGLACEARVRYLQRVERMLVRQELQLARGGACEAVSSRSWLGFSQDWLFCLPMPFLWLLNEQNVDI